MNFFGEMSNLGSSAMNAAMPYLNFGADVGARFLANQPGGKAAEDQARAEDERAAQVRDRIMEDARNANAARRGGAGPSFGQASPMQFANATAAQGMYSHANAMADVNNAISKEMQSRVSQAREARRMQHEQQMQKMQLDALLSRVQQAGGGGAGGMRLATPMGEFRIDNY